jgi:threonine synthase
LDVSNGVVEKVTEQEIADAKAVIGRCGIGCEPASAATLAGIRKMTASGIMRRDADVVAVLTGNVLKDPGYIHEYHTGVLMARAGERIESTFGNPPVVLPNDPDKIGDFLSK